MKLNTWKDVYNVVVMGKCNWYVALWFLVIYRRRSEKGCQCLIHYIFVIDMIYLWDIVLCLIHTLQCYVNSKTRQKFYAKPNVLQCIKDGCVNILNNVKFFISEHAEKNSAKEQMRVNCMIVILSVLVLYFSFFDLLMTWFHVFRLLKQIVLSGYPPVGS